MLYIQTGTGLESNHILRIPNNRQYQDYPHIHSGHNTSRDHFFAIVFGESSTPP